MWRMLPLLAIPAFLLASATPGPRGDTASLWLTALPTRPIEARLSVAAADVHRPYVPARQERATPVPLRELARLEARGDRSGIAASYLVHGDPQQAQAHLLHAPLSPGRENDRAAAAFLLRRHDEALALLDDMLERTPHHPQALWNRGLVLRELGLTLLAASAFEQVAALNEPGWSNEAQEHARTLRAQAQERAQAWRDARDALAALATTPGAPVPLDSARRFPGTARAHFYEAVRSAPSAARVTALLPLAEVLDRTYGGTALARYARRVAARDFSRRGPLAEEYTRLARREHPDPDALIQRLRASGDDDLLLTALLRTPTVPRTAEELEAIAGRWDDPWVGVTVEEELARLEQLAGDTWKAGQRLRSALATCRAYELRTRCLDLQWRMSHLATANNRLAEAEELARTAWREALALGEWEQEAFAIRALGQAARFQFRVSPARAYFIESLERMPGDLNAKNYVYRNLAALALMRLRPEEARRALDTALACNRPVALVGAWILAELGRMAPRDSDAEHLYKELTLVDPQREPPGRRVLATLIRARFELNRDVAKGTALLRQAIAEAEPYLDADADARDSRAMAFNSLAVSAGNTGAFADVPGIVAEQLRVPVPERCMLAAALESERTVLVVKGPEGQLRGHYDATRKEPLGEDLTGLVPRELMAGLRGCRRVDVLAAPPLDSRAGLLPPELTWRYVASAPREKSSPTPARAPLHLVVANVETPPALRLARLPTWDSGPASEKPSVGLSGLEATPSRVLEAMKQATDIEFHAHGMVDRTLSAATVIALAPEPDGRYALTAEALRQVRLEGEPVVLLSACSAARLPPVLHQTSSLPQAFIDAGARAVFAATVDIPNSAGRFFQAVRERIHAGAEPAHALHEERMRWLRTEAGAQWVTKVLLYE
ncbi:MAG TPA: hypothetical protein VE153_19575 [Myxococcus sp.]|nr:hypothetical protein [Myxococcus sp.]